MMMSLSCALGIASSIGVGLFRAGASTRVVTPDPLLPVIGGIGTAHPVTRKMGELTVRVLALESGDVRVAIVGADFLGIPGLLCAGVRDNVKGVAPENILIGATHTHSGPDLFGFQDERGETGADPAYAKWVAGQMAEAIEEAVERLQPASVKIRTDKARGKIAYNYYAPELYDRRMSVIQCLSTLPETEGKPIATLVNYATHPEVLGPRQGMMSPDCIGPLYDRIEEKGGGVAIFMNGAQGGMVTADCRGPEGKDIQTWEECVRIGTLMADEALRIAADAEVQREPELFCAATTIGFPVESERILKALEHSPLAEVLKGTGKIPVQVNGLNLGSAQILTVPGEALPNIGFYLKRKMHGRDNMLFGLTNEELGYMLTKVDYRSFERYDYISETCLGEMTGEIFIEGALKFLDGCPRPRW